MFLTAGAALALIYLWQIGRGKPAEGHMLRSLVKTGSVLALALEGLGGPAPLMILAGLTLGATGDYFLSRPGQKLFLAGMAAFAAGHLAYVAAFWMRMADLGVTAPSLPQGLALAALLLLVLILGLWLSSRAGDLRLPVFAYAMVIGLMAASAVLLPHGPGVTTLQAGVALFLLSDTLLALRLFIAPAKARWPLDLAVWPTYWLGQALILAGASLYWPFPKG